MTGRSSPQWPSWRATQWREELTVLADRGYFKGEEILECAQEGITALVPKPLTSNSKAEGRFDKRDFVYNAKRDDTAARPVSGRYGAMTTVEQGLTLHRYWTSACPKCPIKSQCTPSDFRRISRWEHEGVLDAMQDRLDRTRGVATAATDRRHIFGTLKAWMGSTHFLTKTLERVRTEMSLHVLAYNLKRVIKLLGSRPLIEAIKV